MLNMGNSMAVAVVLLSLAIGACSSSDAATSDPSTSDGGAVGPADAGPSPGEDASMPSQTALADGCVPKTTAYCAANWECGALDDGCGGTVYCGSSTSSGCAATGYSQCGAVTANKCLACTPTTGTCSTGESAYMCPVLEEVPTGCRVVDTHACCPTK